MNLENVKKAHEEFKELRQNTSADKYINTLEALVEELFLVVVDLVETKKCGVRKD